MKRHQPLGQRNADLAICAGRLVVPGGRLAQLQVECVADAGTAEQLCVPVLGSWKLTRPPAMSLDGAILHADATGNARYRKDTEDAKAATALKAKLVEMAKDK